MDAPSLASLRAASRTLSLSSSTPRPSGTRCPQWDSTACTTFSSIQVASIGSRHAARLTEIDTAIREATGLTDDQRNVLKVVGILNVLSQGGPLRASVPIIRYALSSTVPLADRAVRKVIAELEQRGVLTYRDFADEYRLWQGSDLDLGALVEQAREETRRLSPRPSCSPASIACRPPSQAGTVSA